jgi:hypothetical protein
MTNLQINAQRTCGTPVPDAKWDNWFNSKVVQYKADKIAARTSATNYTIPVVVHVLHNGDAIGVNENISFAQIQSAITALNADFAGTNADANNIPQVFQGVRAGNTGISFCLAKVSPNGSVLTEPGVDRINWAARGWQDPNSFIGDEIATNNFYNFFETQVKPNSIWDPSKYFNIWITPMDNIGLGGYATFPSGSGLIGLPNDETNLNSGVVIRHNGFGTVTNFNLLPSYNKNRITTHEVGHWLGLRHIWGDKENCLGDDFCDDTPPQSFKNYGCLSHPYNLGICNGNVTGEMFMNYMDYTNDACKNMFTQDQLDRMQTAMKNGTFRKFLPFSNVCQSSSVINDVRLNDFVTPSSNTINYGATFSITTNVVNRGNTAFAGDYCAAVFDNNNNFVSYVQVLSNYTLPINNTYTNNLTFSTSGILEMIPGNYTIGIFYRPSGGVWMQCGNNGSYVNFVPITVVNPKSIELYSSIKVSTGSSIIQSQPVTVTVDLTNTGTTTFTGQYQVNLYNLDGTFAETINTITESAGLQPNFHYNPPYLNFTKNNITSIPGDYLLAVMFKSNSQTSYTLAGSSYYTNPIRIKVVAPSPDPYEVNNAFTQPFTLPANFVSLSATIRTTGSNFHTTTDQDYYKINLPAGFNYSISARLHDSYNTGNGIIYSADAKFRFSTDGGATWSTDIDDVLNNKISVNGPGVIYFHVLPYYEGQTGTYLLDVAITQCIAPTVSPSGNVLSCSTNPITLVSSTNSGNQWYFNGTPIQNAINNSFTPAISGSYSVVTSNNGCTSSPSNTVNVIVQTFTYNPFQDTLRACGDSVTLNAGAGYSNYVWNNGATTQNINVKTNGLYRVAVSNTGGCPGRDSVWVILNNVNIVQKDTVVCPGSSLTLNIDPALPIGKSCNKNNLPLSLQNGLLAYYPFCSNANDASGNGNNGQVFGATLVADRFGIPNNAYYFNGIDNRIDIPYSTALSTSNFSVAAWIKSDGTRSIQQFIYGQATGRPVLLVNRNSPNFPRSAGVQWTSVDSYPGCNSTSVVDDDKWHFIVGTYSQGLFKIYVDGVLENTATTNLAEVPCNVNFNIGGIFTPPACRVTVALSFQYFKGTIDDVLHYNRELTNSEIQKLFKQQNITYTWSTSETAQNINVAPTFNTKYYLSANFGNSTCLDSISVGVLSKPVITFNFPNLISNYTFGNQWYLNGVIIPGATGQSFTPVQTGNYTVKVNLSNCSSLFSDNYFYNITNVTNLSDGEFLDLYPNPTSAFVLLNYKFNGESQGVRVNVMNSIGQIVSSQYLNQSGIISLSGLTNGVYFLQVEARKSKRIYVKKIIKVD